MLGILAGVAAPRFLDSTGEANAAVTRSSVDAVANQVELQTALNGGKLPLVLDPRWFQNGGLPENPYNELGVDPVQ